MNETNVADVKVMLKRIRVQTAAENVRVTQHAQQEMIEENVLLDEVFEGTAAPSCRGRTDFGKLPRASERSLLFDQWPYPGWPLVAHRMYNSTASAYNHYGL